MTGSLLFRARRIEEEKDKVKKRIFETSQHKDEFEIEIRQFNLSESFLHETIKELQSDHNLKGIIHQQDSRYFFYSENAIKMILLEHKYEFDVSELFPEKSFHERERALIEGIIQRLKKRKKLKGIYNKETMRFLSEDLLNAEKYEDIVKAATRKGKTVISQYKRVLEDLKGILVNFAEPIAPREITTVEEIMNWIVGEQKKWCEEFDAFIAFKSAEVKRNVGLDPSVAELRKRIFAFRYRFNKLSVNYNSIIYYQRLYTARKVDLESKKSYYAILRKHQLIPEEKKSKQPNPNRDKKKDPAIQI
jgi:hypothetical protein